MFMSLREKLSVETKMDILFGRTVVKSDIPPSLLPETGNGSQELDQRLFFRGKTIFPL